MPHRLRPAMYRVLFNFAFMLLLLPSGCVDQAAVPDEGSEQADQAQQGNDPGCVPCAGGRTPDPEAWQKEVEKILGLADIDLATATSPVGETILPASASMNGASYRLTEIGHGGRQTSQGELGASWPSHLQHPAVQQLQALLAGQPLPAVQQVRPAPRLLLVAEQHRSTSLSTAGSWRSWHITSDAQGRVVLAECRWATWRSAEDWQAGSLALVPPVNNEEPRQ